jgi:pimeloyl-ACP methyl ester carboxylesterase
MTGVTAVIRAAASGRNVPPEVNGSRVTATIIDGASHALFPEQPDAVASAVIAYLQTMTHPER